MKSSILSIVRPLSNHVGVSSSVCGLFLNYIEELNFDEGNLRFSHAIKYLVAPAHALDHEEEGGAAAGRRHVHHPGWDEQEKVGLDSMYRLSRLQ